MDCWDISFSYRGDIIIALKKPPEVVINCSDLGDFIVTCSEYDSIHDREKIITESMATDLLRLEMNKR